MNRGNTGQHYRMTTLTSIEVKGKQIVLHLACGHDQTTTPTWCTVELLADILHKRIGKRQRCNRCEPRLEDQPLEQAILKAAENASDDLMDLLQKAIETMDEAQAERLMDKVHQVQSESLRDIRGWRE